MSPSSTLEPGSLAGLRPPWVLVGATVWDGAGSVHTAVSVGADGRVLAVGADGDVLGLRPRGAEVVDARGAFVCPGFVDPHVHVRASASAALAEDISLARTREAVVDAVAQRCRTGRGWATLVGWSSGRDLGHPPLDRHDLDPVSNDRPVRVRERSGHAWLLNTHALMASGIAVASDVPAGVAIEREPDGAPTGFVTDHVGWVGARIGRISDAGALRSAVGAWSRDLVRNGVVGICDATCTNDQTAIAGLSAWRDGALLQETSALLGADAFPVEAAGGTVAIVGTKFSDALDPRLPAALARTAPHGIVAVHCVEPHETAAALEAARSAGLPRRRLRIEHASFVPPDWIEDVRRSGAMVVTHPSFVEIHGDRYLADASLAPHDWLYRVASWERQGVPLAFASDAPFGPANPLRALRAAARRRTTSGRELGPDEALSGDAAVRAVTTTAARAAGLASSGYGAIRPAGPGAVAVLSSDPRSVDGDPATLLATTIGGCVVD